MDICSNMNFMKKRKKLSLLIKFAFDAFFVIANSGATATTTAAPTCPSDEFTCRSGECIDTRFICDGRADCADRSDEFQCGECLMSQLYVLNKWCQNILNFKYYTLFWRRLKIFTLSIL